MASMRKLNLAVIQYADFEVEPWRTWYYDERVRIEGDACLMPTELATDLLEGIEIVEGWEVDGYAQEATDDYVLWCGFPGIGIAYTLDEQTAHIMYRDISETERYKGDLWQ